MQKTSIWLLVTLIWFLFVFNIERLNLLFNFESVDQFYLTISFFLMVLIPARKIRHTYITISGLVLLNFLLKPLMGVNLSGLDLITAVLEMLAIVFTGFLGIQIRSLTQRASSASNLKHGSETMLDFRVGQSQIYKEIRRARRYQRSASLLSISTGEKIEIRLDESSDKLNVHHNTKINVNRRLAELFVTALRDYDVVTFRDNHFIILLPETDRERACETIRRLVSLANEELGIELYVGLATFPDEAVTLESMLEIAEDRTMAAFTAPSGQESKSASVSTNSLLQS